MVDQLYMRHWVTHHDAFSHDLDKGLAALTTAARRLWRSRFSIGPAYRPERPLRTRRSGIGRAGQAMLAGLAASVVTTVLFSGTAFLVLPAGAVA